MPRQLLPSMVGCSRSRAAACSAWQPCALAAADEPSVMRLHMAHMTLPRLLLLLRRRRLSCAREGDAADPTSKPAGNADGESVAEVSARIRQLFQVGPACVGRMCMWRMCMCTRTVARRPRKKRGGTCAGAGDGACAAACRARVTRRHSVNSASYVPRRAAQPAPALWARHRGTAAAGARSGSRAGSGAT